MILAGLARSRIVYPILRGAAAGGKKEKGVNGRKGGFLLHQQGDLGLVSLGLRFRYRDAVASLRLFAEKRGRVIVVVATGLLALVHVHDAAPALVVESLVAGAGRHVVLGFHIHVVVAVLGDAVVDRDVIQRAPNPVILRGRPVSALTFPNQKR